MDTMEMRRNAIAELVNKYGTVSFSQIKEQFPQVSEMTLRTDLKALDAAKEIVRIHGGAKSVQLVIGTDDYLTRRAVRNIQSKQEIAKKAVQLVLPDTVIFLDSGSTTTELARIFPDQSYLIQRPDPHPRFSYDLTTVDIPHYRIPAVRTVIPVITHDKIFIFPKCDRFISPARIKNNLFSIVLLKLLTVNEYRTILINIDCLTRKTYDTLDIICLILIAEWKYYNIESFRIRKPVGNFIYDQIVPIMKCRLHGSTADLRPLSNISNYQKCKDKNDQ